jgi:hypothetical protein
MPYAECWKKLLDIEGQTIIDGINSLTKGTPKLSIANRAVAANTNFIETAGTAGLVNLKPDKTPCLFRIYIALSVSGIFSIIRQIQGSPITTVQENMNQGVALTAAAGYMFDILVDDGERIDFQTTVAATILKMSVVEKDDVK